MRDRDHGIAAGKAAAGAASRAAAGAALALVHSVQDVVVGGARVGAALDRRLFLDVGCKNVSVIDAIHMCSWHRLM